MQTYIVEYKHTPWADDGLGFKPVKDYYDMNRVTIKAQDIDHLRLRIINELAKGKPFRSYVYKPDSKGWPDYNNPVGQLFFYRDGYSWFIRDIHRGWAVSPKTGKRLR